MRTCTCGDCLDVAFSNSILMMSANTTESIGLLLTVTIYFESFGRKETIVAMVGFNVEALLVSKCFEIKFALDSFSSTSGNLREAKNLATSMVDEESATSITCLLSAVCGTMHRPQTCSDQLKWNERRKRYSKKKLFI